MCYFIAWRNVNGTEYCAKHLLLNGDKINDRGEMVVHQALPRGSLIICLKWSTTPFLLYITCEFSHLRVFLLMADDFCFTRALWSNVAFDITCRYPLSAESYNEIWNQIIILHVQGCCLAFVGFEEWISMCFNGQLRVNDIIVSLVECRMGRGRNPKWCRGSAW